MISELEALGCNMNEALERFMNHAELLEKMLKKFPATVNGDGTKPPLEVLPLIERGELKAAEVNAHTLKGVAGNLSLTPLYTRYSDIVDLLRAGDVEKARTLAAEAQGHLEKILSVIG